MTARAPLPAAPADGIRQKPMRTIWHGRFIVGALNLVAGQPGAGKSTLGALIAGELSRKGATGIVSDCEDDASSVVVPRLVVAGAILERVHVIPMEDAPLFPRDFDLLEQVIDATGSRYVMLDPIASHFAPEYAVHKRPILRQLAGIARRTSCAIIAMHHVTKGNEVGGPNSGLRGTSRAVYIYGFDPEDADRRALSCDKINGTDDPPALLFEHETTEYYVGGEAIEAGKLRRIRQSNVSASVRRGQRNKEKDEACHAWLSEFLATAPDCSRRSSEVYAQGADHEYGQATLKRAKTELEVEHVREGGYGADGWWTWRLPDGHPLRQREGEDE